MEAVKAESFAILNPNVAQAIALASHANAFLRGRLKEPPELLGANSSFRLTYELTFDRLGPGERPFPLADGTAPWLRRLAKEQVQRMHLVLTPLALERAARVAGLPEPRWGLVTEGDVGTEIWCPNCSILPGVNARDVAAPWRVSWQAEKSERGVRKGDAAFPDSFEKLAKSLQSMTAFVTATGSPAEQSAFEELQAAIADGKAPPELTIHSDLFDPALFGLSARRAGIIGLCAMGLVVAAGWKDRILGLDEIQVVFDAARAGIWRHSVALIQASVNSLAG